MNYVRIGKRTLNLDSVSYAEVQTWQDEMTVKVISPGWRTTLRLSLGKTMPRNSGNIWSISQKSLSHNPAGPASHFAFNCRHKVRIV